MTHTDCTSHYPAVRRTTNYALKYFHASRYVVGLKEFCRVDIIPIDQHSITLMYIISLVISGSSKIVMVAIIVIIASGKWF